MSDTEANNELETVLTTFWQKAEQAQAEGNETQARAWLEGIVDLDEGNVEAWLALARLVADARERMQCYSHVLQLSPGNQEAKQGLRQARRQL
jgi:thioredoxin-like negative regulator of GroEL